MVKSRRIKCSIIVLTLFVLQQMQAQDVVEGQAAIYMNTASHFAALYSGNCQQPLGFRTVNHQYFKERNYVSGKLSYNGIVYTDVMLRWDLYRDEILLLSPVSSNIVLINDYIDFAEIHGYRIIYLHPDGLPGCPAAGNYIMLYSGKNLLLEKLSNSPNVADLDGKRYTYKFLLSSHFYFKKDDVYHKIKNSGKLLKILDTHKKELKQYTRAHNYKYKRDAEKMLTEIIKEHEKLSNYE